MEIKQTNNINLSTSDKSQEVSSDDDKSISCNPNITDSELIKAQHYATVCSKCNGMNIKQASRATGIAFSTLHDELRMWEFAGLIKLTKDFQNGRAVVIIQTGEKQKESSEPNNSEPVNQNKSGGENGTTN